MIDKLMYSSRTTEVDAASMRIVAAFKKSNLNTDSHLTGIFASLETGSASLTGAINRIKIESELEAKDEIRDDLLRALHYLLLGFAHHPDNTIKEAALKVSAVFDKYGLGIVNESYASESSLVNSLLMDLGQADLQDAIAALPGFDAVHTALKDAESVFEQTRIAYEEEKAKEGTKENATVVKKEVLDIINNKLVLYLRAMMQVDETLYGDFGRTIAQVIADSNEAVKRRRKPANA